MRGYDTDGKAHQLPLGSLLPVDRPGQLLVLPPYDSFSLCTPLADLRNHFLNVDLVCTEEGVKSGKKEETAEVFITCHQGFRQKPMFGMVYYWRSSRQNREGHNLTHLVQEIKA